MQGQQSNPNLMLNQIGGKIKIDLSHTRYKLLKEVANEIGWKPLAFTEPVIKKPKPKEDPIKEENDDEEEEQEKKRVQMQVNPQMCDLNWHDVAVDGQKLSTMKRF